MALFNAVENEQLQQPEMVCGSLIQSVDPMYDTFY